MAAGRQIHGRFLFEPSACMRDQSTGKVFKQRTGADVEGNA
jgi:hypothetical protein